MSSTRRHYGASAQGIAITGVPLFGETSEPYMATNPMRHLRHLPIVGPAIARTARLVREFGFKGSTTYWDNRYRKGGSSGPGSYGRLAEYKASIINDIVTKHDIRTVIEFGCGDGHQLELARYNSYIGFDVSPKAVEICRARFSRHADYRFSLVADYDGETADLTMSLDVIYHLVEDDIFEKYMELLFDSSKRFVLLYSSDAPMPQFDAPHVKTRKFSDWVRTHRPQWHMVEYIKNKFPYDVDNPGETSFSDFYLYRRLEKNMRSSP
jgi:SAM-dependent methyltransferase